MASSARELDLLMRKHFGDDYRSKALVTPLGAFRLADAFSECGIDDPCAPRETSRGLLQIDHRFYGR